ncbi:MAG TPA: efflux RND transporter permease subunit [Candidatus Limnocylindrales bacterium]
MRITSSWRSTLIVCISIPLSILTSLIILHLMGHTINVMTLGGLALAVGILVDDATVEIENTHRNMAMRKPLVRAVLDGAQQIAAPAFVSTLAICIVFVPVILLTGAARYLFTPLAFAVVFAMLASYLLSRTLIPTMVHYLLKQEVKLYVSGTHESGRGPIWFVHNRFNLRFERMRGAYTGMLDWVLDHRLPVFVLFVVFAVGSMALVPFVGQDFFPKVDSGQIRLHARAPSGTRIEQTEVVFTAIDQEIRLLHRRRRSIRQAPACPPRRHQRRSLGNDQLNGVTTVPAPNYGQGRGQGDQPLRRRSHAGDFTVARNGRMSVTFSKSRTTPRGITSPLITSAARITRHVTCLWESALGDRRTCPPLVRTPPTGWLGVGQTRDRVLVLLKGDRAGRSHPAQDLQQHFLDRRLVPRRELFRELRVGPVRPLLPARKVDLVLDVAIDIGHECVGVALQCLEFALYL